MSLFLSNSILVKMCQFTGLMPYSFLKTKTQWKLNLLFEIFNWINVIFFGIIFICYIIFINQFEDHKAEKVLRILTYSLFVTTNVEVIVSLLEVFIKRHRNIKLMNLFCDLDKMVKEVCNGCVDLKRIKKMCRPTLIISILQICQQFTNFGIAIYINKMQTVKYILIYFTPYIMCKLISIKYTLNVCVLCEYLIILNTYLKELIEKSERDQLRKPLFKKSIYLRVKPASRNVDNETEIENLRKMFSLIWECSVMINDLFYWTMPIELLNEIILIVFQSIWSIIHLAHGNFVFGGIISFYVVIRLMKMLCIMIICMKTSKAVICFFFDLKKKIIFVENFFTIC